MWRQRSVREEQRHSPTYKKVLNRKLIRKQMDKKDFLTVLTIPSKTMVVEDWSSLQKVCSVKIETGFQCSLWS